MKQEKYEDEPDVEEKISVSEQIESYALEKNLDVLSAIMEISREKGWEPEWFASYVTGPLKEKLRIEGERIGLLKRTDNPMIRFE